MKVLAVHPDDSAVEQLAQALPKAEIRRAVGLSDALPALTSPPDLVIVAETLSDGAGVDLADQMRAREVLATIVLVPQGPFEVILGRALALGVLGNGTAQADESSILNSRQAAAYLGLSQRFLQRMARMGRVPAFQAGRGWRFRRAELDGWIRSAVSAGEAK